MVAQLLIQMEGGLIGLKDLEADLAIALGLCPLFGLLHQRGTDALSPMFWGNVEQKNVSVAIACALIDRGA